MRASILWTLGLFLVIASFPNNARAQASDFRLTVQVEPSAPGFYLAEARLRDVQGNPVAAAPIAFYERTTFGRALIETAKTNKQGIASVEAKIPNRTLNLIATYCESAKSCRVEAEAQMDVRVAESSTPFDARPADLNTPYPPPLPTALLILVLGGVWSIFGLVVYQVYRIRRAPPEPSQKRRWQSS